MARALLEVARHCDEADTIRCVVITGRGKLFCGVGDIAIAARSATFTAAYGALGLSPMVI
jgi:2-(1,2-epoxy-1,2-dihydrophenyl)acetyl-CoA isomerase